jgi:hypothetical protein
MPAGRTFSAGDAFRPANRNIDIHLWVIVSDPDQDRARVLIVSLTTYKPHKEPACLLKAGDHPAVKHDTCIAYDLAKVTTVARLEEARDRGLLHEDAPVSDDVLKRIREGSALSKRIAIEHVELLEAQGLV